MLRSLIAGTILVASTAANAQVPLEIEARLPPPYFRAYVIAVCAASQEITDDCVQEGQRNAAYALSEMYLRAYRGGYVFNSLRLRFPYGWTEASQMRLLRDIEGQGIALASDKISREGSSQGDHKLQTWRASALMEAVAGGNWSHDWSQYRHDFAPAHVTRQLAAAELRR